MKKIVAIGMVKNSADIIESFIRCNGVWADKFVLLDNMSTDRTVEILNFLKKEGYDIEIFPDDEIAYYQSEKMNALLSYVYEKYAADYIVPIDDDEILTIDSRNVKEAICELKDGEVYQIPWRIYTPHEDDDMGITSIPKRITHYFACSDSNYIPGVKVILTKGAIDNYPGISLSQGNHSVYGYEKEIMDNTELILAHYPCRSDEQLRSKALVGWTGYLTMVKDIGDWGYQWKAAYEFAKNGEPFPLEVLKTYSKLYYISDAQMEVFEASKRINLPDKCFEIYYSFHNEVNYMKNYCNAVEELAKKYAELSKKELLGE